MDTVRILFDIWLIPEFWTDFVEFCMSGFFCEMGSHLFHAMKVVGFFASYFHVEVSGWFRVTNFVSMFCVF